MPGPLAAHVAMWLGHLQRGAMGAAASRSRSRSRRYCSSPQSRLSTPMSRGSGESKTSSSASAARCSRSSRSLPTSSPAPQQDGSRATFAGDVVAGIAGAVIATLAVAVLLRPKDRSRRRSELGDGPAGRYGVADSRRAWHTGPAFGKGGLRGIEALARRPARRPARDDGDGRRRGLEHRWSRAGLSEELPEALDRGGAQREFERDAGDGDDERDGHDEEILEQHAE